MSVKTGRAVLSVLAIFTVAMALVFGGMTGLAEAGAVNISPSEFTSDGWSDFADYFKSFSKGTLSGSSAHPCLVAPVKIPGTATRILRLIVYLTDNGTGAIDPFFRLTGMNMKTGITTTYAESYVATGSVVLQGIEVPLAADTITRGESIALGVCLANGQVLYGAKVKYQ